MSISTASTDDQSHCICCLVCLVIILTGILAAVLFGAIPIIEAHPHGPPPSPPPQAQVQLTSALVSSTSSNTSRTSSLLGEAVWLLTIQVAFPRATTTTAVHYDSFRASVLFDSGGGRGQLEMAAARLPTPFDAKGDSTFNLRLKSKPAGEVVNSVQDRLVVGSILSDMVAAGSVDFGVWVVASVRIDTKKQTKVASIRADCSPVRIGFSGPNATAGEDVTGSLPISIACDVH